jgi:hypothetical protein
LVLTVLAWTWLGLGMQGVALAPAADCCAGMAMAMSVPAASMTHEAPSGAHTDGMTAANCPCAHSAASLPRVAALNLAMPMPPTRPSPVAASPAPQPMRIPLLRPPSSVNDVAKQNA